MRSLQKYAAVTLVLGGSAPITGNPSGESNIESMAFGVEMIGLA
jgi:hypothetical protein